MRISTNMIYGQSIYNLNRQYEQYFKQNEIVSTGKRVNRPSDDPIGMVKVLGLRTLESSFKQFEKNINDGTSWLRYTESALSSAEKIFHDAKVMAEQMSTGTYNEDQRELLAVQAEQLFDQLMQVGNTKVVGKYIFSGFRTDTRTFTKDANYNIEYHGDNNKINISINQSTKITINTTGQKAFLDDTNVFDILRDLRQGLKNNDQHAIQETLPRIDDALNQILKELSSVGTSIQQMESAEMMIEDFGFNTEELLSDTEDADIIDAVMMLEERKVVLQAALKSTTMITGLTILNYM